MSHGSSRIDLARLRRLGGHGLLVAALVALAGAVGLGAGAVASGGEDGRVHSLVAQQPHVVRVSTPGPVDVAMLDGAGFETLADRLAAEILAEIDGVTNWVVIDPSDLPRAFAWVGEEDRAVLEQAEPGLADSHYVQRCAYLLSETMERVAAARPSTPLAVMGLPFEASGRLGDEALALNELYRGVMERSDFLVSGRSFIRLGGGVDPSRSIRLEDELPEALQLRGDRHVFFRLNRDWRLIPPGRDLERSDDDSWEDESDEWSDEDLDDAWADEEMLDAAAGDQHADGFIDGTEVADPFLDEFDDVALSDDAFGGGDGGEGGGGAAGGGGGGGGDAGGGGGSAPAPSGGGGSGGGS